VFKIILFLQKALQKDFFGSQKRKREDNAQKEGRDTQTFPEL
jgi:hypothetical protein